MISLPEGWKEQLQSMSNLERQGLMRNPKLSTRLIVALLKTPSEELAMTRKEHAELLSMAALSPYLIAGSRNTGRRAWIGGGEGNPPFEEYGTMWELCVEKWIGELRVPYLFIRYIQTTPEVKLGVYKRLLERPEDRDYKTLRAELVRSCDPLVDASILKLAWDDPDEEPCRKIARERVGKFTKFVGVQST